MDLKPSLPFTLQRMILSHRVTNCPIGLEVYLLLSVQGNILPYGGCCEGVIY
jgi:hypothetical protein